MVIKRWQPHSFPSSAPLPVAHFGGRKSSEDDDDDDMDDDSDDDADLDFAPRASAGEGGKDSSAKPKTLTRKEALEILSGDKNFSGMDLRKANLTKLDFSGSNFSGSNLSYTNFKDSNLEGCNFANSSLWNANLEGANMTRCNFEDADLDYSKLRGAIMYKANVKRTTLPTDLIPREEILRSVQEGTKITR